ncbi:MAG: hypothetical protein K0S46_360 [Moraxellaceae bacterium]|jgi:tetratricopeptide (TPR) repeat protein|nr:hypothetical protein [Moraxellaceae bacterium]
MISPPSMPNADLQRSLMHFARAEALRQQNQLSQAAVAYQQAIGACAMNGAPYVAFLKMLLDAGKLEGARKLVSGMPPALYQQSRKLQFLTAILLLREDAYEEARKILESLAGSPDINEAQRLFQLGSSLGGLGRLDEAIAHFTSARQLGLEDASLFVALALAYQKQGAFGRAESLYVEALKKLPDDNDLNYEYAMLLLRKGDYAKGFKRYDRRWRVSITGLRKPEYPVREWRNGPAPKSLLVITEQGIGDQIAFAALLPSLRKQVDRLDVALDPRLNPLLARVLPDTTLLDYQRSNLVEAAGEYDACIFAGDLGAVTRDGFDDHSGYLKPDAARTEALRHKYRSRFPGKRLIGISWKSPKAPLDACKSIPIEQLAGILGTPDCQFISIQYGDIAADRETLHRQLGIDLHQDLEIDALNDIDGLAAQIAALDLVITISNTTAHVSAALGQRTWILLTKGRAQFWYWGLDQDTTPWYPTAHLFRATREGDWRDVLERVEVALRSA